MKIKQKTVDGITTTHRRPAKKDERLFRSVSVGGFASDEDLEKANQKAIAELRKMDGNSIGGDSIHPNSIIDETLLDSMMKFSLSDGVKDYQERVLKAWAEHYTAKKMKPPHLSREALQKSRRRTQPIE